ncbi:uncharacterized protein SOCEGT47_059640 [Sorangium cellulosum]|uniref:PIN domain-containing protein n=1 Tax=Sorangium cellulosum TaxID=56 RepID=A0A4P2Q8B9_SORCE|nr:uncharacterized protein SOCEGT47_059640 [Sorangium cellulosum]
MIVLDTHVWIWWVQGDPRLCREAVKVLEEGESTGLGVSAISAWEIAKLVERGRLTLPRPALARSERGIRYRPAQREERLGPWPPRRSSARNPRRPAARWASPSATGSSARRPRPSPDPSSRRCPNRHPSRGRADRPAPIG